MVVYYNALNTILLHKLIIGIFGGEMRPRNLVIGWEPGEPLMDLTSQCHSLDREEGLYCQCHYHSLVN